MTRKDYELIAEVIHHVFISWDDTELVAEAFAEMLKKGNPRFDKEMFIKACLGG